MQVRRACCAGGHAAGPRPCVAPPPRPRLCPRAALPPEVVDLPPPVEEWQLWTGAIIGALPFPIAAYEFGKRIWIQRQCALCGGSGLVVRGGLQRKCSAVRFRGVCVASAPPASFSADALSRQCGGFFPWRSWKDFLSLENPGNGGPLRFPQGQTSVFFDVDAAKRAGEAAKRRADEQAAAALGAVEGEGGDGAAQQPDAKAPES